jgi:biopolymer transport protein ExbD
MSAKKPSQRTHRSRPDDSLNLTPMIDMITCLMFFLLMFATLLPVAIIDAPLPKIASTAEEVKKAKDTSNKLEVMVWISPKGFQVKSDVAPEKSFAAAQNGELPFEELHKFLVQLKQKRPNSKEITFMPSDDTPYAALVEVMDAARDLNKEDAGYQNIPAELQGKPESEQFNRLFPEVSIGGV